MSCLVAGVVSWALPPGAAVAAEMSVEPQTQTIVVAASDYGSRSVALGVGKSVVIDSRATSRTFWSPIPRSRTP
jgi:hypothetical protein